MNGINEISDKINGLCYKSAGIFTNSLLHTNDTTQLIRDIRDDEIGLFQNRKISDIDNEVMNNIKDFDEKLLDEIMENKTDVDPEILEEYPENMIADFKELEIIKERLRKISNLDLESDGELHHSLKTVKQLLTQAYDVIEEAKNSRKNINKGPSLPIPLTTSVDVEELDIII